MKLDVSRVGSVDPRLELVLTSVKKAVKMLIDGLDKLEYQMRFKAFDIRNIEKEEDRNNIISLILEAYAIELKDQGSYYMEELTFGYDVEKVNDKHYMFWMEVVKEKPDYSNIKNDNKDNSEINMEIIKTEESKVYESEENKVIEG